jgi:diguanylate cyclase (GGDEF)-like protein/PAS domain S-box-containing protein
MPHDPIAKPEHDQRFRLLVEAIQDYSIYMLDPQGRVATWNAGAQRNKGYAADEIIGRHFACFFTDEDVEQQVPQRLLEQATRHGHAELEGWHLRKDGSRFWASALLDAIVDSDGKLSGFAKLTRDLSERQSQQAALRASEERFRMAMQHSAVGMALVGLDGQWLQVNRAVCDLLGYSQGELLQRTFQELTHPDDLDADLSLLRDLREERIDSYRIEKRYLRKDGGSVWGLLAVSLVRNGDGERGGEPQYFIAQIQDIDYIKRIERELHEQKDRLHVTLYSIGEGVITTDNSGRIDFMNPVAEQLTGWSLSQVRGKPVEQAFHVVHAESGNRVENPVRACLADQRTTNMQPKSVLIARSGERYDVQDSASPIRTEDGHMVGAVLVFQNITHLRSIQRELAFQAQHDPLTGLPNRRHFEEALNEAARSARNQPTEHVLCFLDLDQFKLINDTAGHAAGDMVLRLVTRTLCQGVRSGDLVARLGGDEFAIILYGCSVERAHTLLSVIGNAIATLQLPWEGQVYRITASIGLAGIDQSSEFGHVLMKQADIACYTAKHDGRNRVAVYTSNQQDIGSAHRDLLMAAEIRGALAQNRLCMHFQRIIALEGEDTPHYEALLRIIDQHGQATSPSNFIRAAERYDLMGEIDRWVLIDILELKGAQLAVIPQLKLSINLSANSLNDPRFLPFFLDLIERSALKPTQLSIEITETALINNLLAASEMVQRIHAIGCRIALDDFGVGLSSFNYLRTFPVDYIKIDGSFIRQIDQNPVDLAISKAINHVAHEVGAKTIAEYVESEAILACVRSIGVDYAQGHAVGQPIELAQLLALYQP